jgi:uncharacterized repeat protein (TIGR01451 family)
MSLKRMSKIYLFLFLAGVLALTVYSGDILKCDAADGMEGVVRNSMAYPGGYVVILEISAPAKVRLGELFDTEIKATNLIDNKVEEVVVTGKLPKELKFSSSDPTAKTLKTGELQWTLGALEPRSSKAIRVSGSATEMVDLTSCFEVTYRLPICITVKVVKPELALVKTAPSEVILCDPIPMKLVVTNTGVGLATNVKINDPLPDGWATTDGRTTLTFDAGSLGAGQSREFEMVAKSSKTGTFINKAMATADGGLTAEASSTTMVRLPVLELTKTGPKKINHGRRITYNLKLTNTGDAEARDTILEDIIPSNTTFISDDSGGQYSDVERKVSWNLGTLQPNDTRTVNITVRTDQYGKAINVAKATAYCAKASASTETEILGIPGTLLEVVDIEDPIQLGNTATYDITVTNQGTDPNTGIKIVVEFESALEYVSSSGLAGPATTGTLVGSTLTFAPVEKLNPKEKVAWRIIAKAVEVADTRFKVTLTSNELEREVGETESTHLYEGE